MTAARRLRRHLGAMERDARELLGAGRKKMPAALVAEIEGVLSEADAAGASGEPARMLDAEKQVRALLTTHLRPFRRRIWLGYAAVVAGAVVLALLLRVFVLEGYWIPSGSMVPTLLPGDVVLVEKSSYGIHLPGRAPLLRAGMPARGDVIVFESPVEPGKNYIKRVAGLPGDTLRVEEGVLSVDGVPEERALVSKRFEFWNYRADLRYWAPSSGELYLTESGAKRHALLQSPREPGARTPEGPFMVPAGNVFVVGDNRDRSEDSRDGWFVPLSSIRGRAVRVAFSWGRGGRWPWGEDGVRLGRLGARIDGDVPEGGTLEGSAQSYRTALSGQPAFHLP